jgi:hypothetical protein
MGCRVRATSKISSLVAAVPALLVLFPFPASAGGYIPVGPLDQRLALSCDNGRVYPFRVRAISDVGEIVTGYLRTSPHGAVHVRLIPMGDGYRYAGRGVWFDGKGELAVLYFGERYATNCTIVRDGGYASTARRSFGAS